MRAAERWRFYGAATERCSIRTGRDEESIRVYTLDTGFVPYFRPRCG